MASLAGLNGISLPSFGSSMDPEAARALRSELAAKDLLAQRAQGVTTLYASDSPGDFAALAGQFLDRPIEKDAVGLVDIERY